MPAIGKITLDIKDYEAKLAQAKKQGEAAARNAEKNANTASKGVNNFGKSVGKAGSLVSSFGSAAGGSFGQAGSVISSLASGPVAALTAAFGALVAVAVNIWDRMTLSAEEYAKKLDYISQRAEKNRAAVEKQAAEDSGYMDRLQELASKERLSNEAKTEAANLIKMLTSRYGDLGISIDAVTGKIIGMDAAQQKCLERQRKNRAYALAEQSGALKDKTDNKIKQAQGAGYWSRMAMTDEERAKIDQVYSAPLEKQLEYAQNMFDRSNTEEDMNKWQEVIDLLEKRIQLEKELRRVMDTGSATEKEQATVQQKKTDKAQKKEDFLAAEKEALEIQKLIAQGRTEEAKVLKLINEMKKQGVTLSKQEAEEIIRKRQQVASDTYYKDTIEDLENQIQIQGMLNAGMTEEAKRQQIINDLKRRGLAYDEASVNRIMELNRQLGSLKLQKSQKDEAESLYDRALRAAGRSKEADERAALKKARDTKGSDLTEDEKQNTLSLLQLSSQLTNLQNGPNFGDLSIKTNDLTSRGGFQGGAVVPDKDKYNQQIAEHNKSILSVVQRIESMVGRFGEF